MVETLLGLSVGASQVDRLMRFYGGAIADDLDLAAAADLIIADDVDLAAAAVGVVYAQADGAMLLTDEGHKEVKLGRVFAATTLQTSAV